MVLAGSSCYALAQTSPFSPNGIEYVSEADTFTAGTTYNITVQILYDGGPLKSEGVRVYFTATDTSIIPAELGTYALTDKYGVANMTFTANKAGKTNLTAAAMDANSKVSAEKTFQVVQGAVETPTPTPMPSPSVTPIPASVTATPVPSNATATPVPANETTPSIEPTPTAMPTVAPTVTVMPTAQPSPEPSGTQAIGIIVAGIALAVVLFVLVLIARTLLKK